MELKRFLPSVLVAALMPYAYGEEAASPTAISAPESERPATPTIQTVADKTEPDREKDEALLQGDEIIVTASKYEQRLLKAHRSATLVSQQKIRETAPRSTPEALVGATGVYVQESNYGGGSPYIRGSIGQQVLVLVDGVRLNNSTFRYGPNQYLNTIDQWTIERIEVIRGPGSIQNGADAIGGTINIITKQPALKYPVGESEVGGFLGFQFDSASWGRNSRMKLDGHYLDNLAYQVGFSAKYFDNLRGGKDTSPETDGEQLFTGYSEYDFDAATRLYFSETTYLNITYFLVRQMDVPKTSESTLDDYTIFDNQNRDHLILSLVTDFGSSKENNLELTFSYQNQYEKRSRTRLAPPAGAYGLELADIGVGTVGMLANFHSFPQHWLSYSVGVDYYNDSVESERWYSREADTLRLIPTSRGPYIGGSSYSIGGFFLEVEAEIIDRLFLIPSGRYYYFSADIPGVSYSPTARIGADAGSPPFAYSEDGVVGAASLQYFIFDDWAVTTGVYQGFRAPNLDDFSNLSRIFGKFYEVPNNDIKPEKATGYELGTKYFGKYFSAQLTGYITALNDLIGRANTTYNGETHNLSGEQFIHKTNIGEAEIYGVEAELSGDIIYEISAYANAAYTYGKLTNMTGVGIATCEEVIAGISDANERKLAAETCSDDALRRIPPFFGAFGLRWRYGKWFRTELSTLWATRQDRLAPEDVIDARIPPGGTGGYFVPSLLFAAMPVKDMEVSLKLVNLFDESFRTHGSAIDSAGRSVNLNLSIDFSSLR